MHIWFNLFRKEWLEHRWKLASLCVIAIGVFLVCGFGEWNEVTQAAMVTCVGYALVAPIFVGMSVSASETSQGTLAFVAAQPVAMEQTTLIRWLSGMLLLLSPICLVTFLAVLIESLVPQKFGMFWDESVLNLGQASWHGLTLGGVMAANLYAWITAIAGHQRTELRGALVGMIVTFVMLLLSITFLEGSDNPRVTAPLSMFGLISTPLGGFAWWLLKQRDSMSLTPVVLAWQIVVILLLLGVFVGRYGQIEPLTARWKRWWETQAVRSLGMPRSSPSMALVWLQWRESIPVCFAGVAGTILILLVFGLGSSLDGVHLRQETFTWLMGLATASVSLMIGAVGFTNDLQPKLYTFWRSRPIAPTQWFWLRYGAGFASISLFYLFPMTLLGVTAIVQYGNAWLLVFLPLVSLVVYSLGVFCACTVRQPVYAVILAACGAMLVFLAPDTFPSLRSVSIEGYLKAPPQATVGQAMLGIAAAIALAGTISAVTTIAAAVSLKRDLHFRV
ncbi:MAG: hypothetical protein KDA52_15760 [Planctomycetaceae bacterium]|nr:hypothetical protein [Planctomycetaceae bacterium]